MPSLEPNNDRSDTSHCDLNLDTLTLTDSDDTNYDSLPSLESISDSSDDPHPLSFQHGVVLNTWDEILFGRTHW